MKYRTEVLINKSIDVVVAEMRNKESAFKWMNGLESFDLIEGQMEEPGSKYKMVFMNKGKKQEMIETITVFDPPKNITTTYEMGSVFNICENQFVESGEQTKYIMDTEFQFGCPWKLFTWAIKGIFKKETLKGMEDFKAYVETLN